MALESRVVNLLCKILPARYNDDIFISSFVKGIDLKMLSLRETAWCFTHGFLPYEYLWYNLANNNFRDYVPARNNYQKRGLNGSYNAVLGNKMLFENHLKSRLNGIEKIQVVESVGYMENGRLHSLQKRIITDDFSSLQDILATSDLVLKPMCGDGGIGLILISQKDKHYLFNDRAVDGDKLLDSLKKLDGYLIQIRIRQCGFSNEICPGSVNTMRIGTMIDPVTNKPFIAYAVHRFGSSLSGFVDNINQGGMVAMIDLNEGTLGKAIYASFHGQKISYDLHPISSRPIYNQKLPWWQDIVTRITEMAGRMPYLKYVGWDLILSDDELYVLEGNVSPGLGLIQMFKPMKEFPAAWNFFKHYKFVK